MATIENFIETVINNDIKKMISTGFNIDKKDFFKQGCSGCRFRLAIDKLGAFCSYRKYNKKCDPYDLYTNLRCGMAHIGKPDKKIVFTERNDSEGKDKHLRICEHGDSTTRLILGCEDLFSDLSTASKKLIEKMKSSSWAGKSHFEEFMNPNLQILAVKPQLFYIDGR